jgi:hypothetical protein
MPDVPRQRLRQHGIFSVLFDPKLCVYAFSSRRFEGGGSCNRDSRSGMTEVCPPSLGWLNAELRRDIRRSLAGFRRGGGGWLGGRESHVSFFACLPPFAIVCQVFQILQVRRSISFHRPSSVYRLLRILPARCHSKCHSLRASTQILLSKRASNSFAKPRLDRVHRIVNRRMQDGKGAV